MSTRGRRLAFDYGSVRIGVAVCDPDAILATPLAFLSATHPKLNQQIEDLLDEYQPIEIFIGYPKHLSGADGESVAGAVPINHKGVARGLIRVGPTRRVGARTAGEWM